MRAVGSSPKSVGVQKIPPVEFATRSKMWQSRLLVSGERRKPQLIISRKSFLLLVGRARITQSIPGREAAALIMISVDAEVRKRTGERERESEP